MLKETGRTILYPCIIPNPNGLDALDRKELNSFCSLARQITPFKQFISVSDSIFPGTQIRPLGPMKQGLGGRRGVNMTTQQVLSSALSQTLRNQHLQSQLIF